MDSKAFPRSAGQTPAVHPRSQIMTIADDHRCRRFFARFAWAWLLIAAGVPVGAHAVEAEWIMYRDPLLKRPPIETRFPPGLVECWLKALAMPEREMKRGAAAAIIRAHPMGLEGLDAAVAPLMDLLRNPEEDRIVRLTAARALVTIDARRAAPLLFESAKPADLDMAEIVEPAFARWAYAPMRDRWLERLGRDVGLSRMHVLAIRGLAALGAKESSPRLLELAEDRSAPPAVRLAAAAGLGLLEENGLLDSARKLSRDKTALAMVDRLAAAGMLAGHREAEANGLLVELAGDPEPSVRSAALANLFAIDPGLILPIIQDTIACGDADVRHWGAKALVARPSAETLAALGPMLDDRHPGVRRYVCDSLVALAGDPSLRDMVLAQGRRMLHSDGWRGQEQAALLLVTLGDTTIPDRLLQLLGAARPEVHVAAAWGLCQLAVPSSVEPIFKVLQEKTEACLAGKYPQERIGDQLALLAQAIGVLKFTPADELLQKYIRKGGPLGDSSRAAAIWALGHLHAGRPDEALAEKLRARLVDLFSEEPESEEVGRMAAISLGRMKADKTLPTLRSTCDSMSLGSEVGSACGWAIRELTGEEMPPLAARVVLEDDWFLVPIVGESPNSAGAEPREGNPPE